MCLADCENPTWAPLWESLKECCDQHHSWTSGPENYNQCMGISTTTSSPTKLPTKDPALCSKIMMCTLFLSTNTSNSTPHSLVYYSKNNVETCVRDCQQDLWVPPPLYNTLQECCNVHHYWIEGEGNYNQCMGLSPTSNPTNFVSLLCL